MTDTTDIPRRIAEILIERLELEGYTPDDLPRDAILFAPDHEGGLDLDSIASLELVAALSDEYDLDFEDVDREHFMSINSLAAYVGAELEAKSK